MQLIFRYKNCVTTETFIEWINEIKKINIYNQDKTYINSFFAEVIKLCKLKGNKNLKVLLKPEGGMGTGVEYYSDKQILPILRNEISEYIQMSFEIIEYKDNKWSKIQLLDIIKSIERIFDRKFGKGSVKGFVIRN